MKFCVPAHAINECRYIPKCDKYIARIEFYNHPQKEFWLTEKQARALESAFKGDKYSNKNNQAYVILETNEKGTRFIWAVSGLLSAEKSAAHFDACFGWEDEQGDDNQEGDSNA